MSKCNRFSVRKIKVGSYSRQGWLLSDRESYAVIDRDWRKRDRGYRSEWEVRDQYMYVRGTEWNNKDFVKALAKQLNETVGTDYSVTPDGWRAQVEVLKRDVGSNDTGSYAAWCDKFSVGFRPVEKFQKV